MNKYVVVHDGKIKRVVVSPEMPSLSLKRGESLHPIEGRVRHGEKFETEPVNVIAFPVKPRTSYKDLFIGAALTAGLGGLGFIAHLYFFAH